MIHVDSECLDLPVKIASLYPYGVSRPAYVAYAIPQLTGNELSLELGACIPEHRKLKGGFPRIANLPRICGPAANGRRHIAGTQNRTWHHDDKPLDEIAEFSHISRPGVSYEECKCIILYFLYLLSILA